MNNIIQNFLVRGTAVALLFGANFANSTESTETLASWDEPTLQISLPGSDGDTVLLGEHYQVLVTAKTGGHLYLVHQNSQERANGKVRLVEVARTIPGFSGGTAFMYPTTESLKASPPLGMSSVQAIYSNQPLDLSATPNNAGEYTLTEEQLSDFLNAAVATNPDLKFSRESFGFEVAMAEGELEHTTRGIARQISTAITSADLEPDNDGVLTSFDTHIQFEFGTAEPTFNGRLQLDAFGDVLTRDGFSHISFVVAGHTDDVGTRDFNLDLSEARAKAVVEYLESNYGVPSTRMVVEALGEDAPLVDNVDSESRAINRRVEFTLLD